MLNKLQVVLPLLVIAIFAVQIAEFRAVAFRSDLIQTKYGPEETDDDPQKPGWMRRQLMKFGQMASNVGNSLGKHATIVTNAVDKVCEVVKSVIPLLSAVCTVGQFKFCSATEAAPENLVSALKPNMDLNLPD